MLQIRSLTQIFGDRPVTTKVSCSSCFSVNVLKLPQVQQRHGGLKSWEWKWMGHAMILNVPVPCHTCKANDDSTVKQKTPPYYPSRPCQLSCLVQSAHHHMPLDGAPFLISSLNFCLKWLFPWAIHTMLVQIQTKSSSTSQESRLTDLPFLGKLST